MNSIEAAGKIAAEVQKLGGNAYFVGGCVRDELLGAEMKDIDIEIHSITPSQLEQIIDSIGERIAIGESFGIYGIKGIDLDIAMPRCETNRGHGHRDFDIFVDPLCGTEKAAERRDFTINAMMKNILTGEVIDHFGGRSDLERKTLRHVNGKTFTEDPLRVLRGAQFAARFGFETSPETVELCRSMKLDSLPRERIFAELEKAMMKSDRPSVFFEFLRKANQLDTWFPEVKALIGVEQSKKHHPEGDAYIHTLAVIDAAAKYKSRASAPISFMLSALCHDFGKPMTTEFFKGDYHAYGHETAGLAPAERFIGRLTGETAVMKYVLNMVKNHMRPNILAGEKSSIKATNKMFDESVDPMGLIMLALCDGGIKQEYDSRQTEEFLTERLKIYDEYMSRPFVTGRDLIEAGLTPGEKFGEYLDYAHKLRLSGTEKKSALTQTLAFARKCQKKFNKN